MAICDFPDMYAQSPRVEGIHIRQITNDHVTSIMHQFVPIVTIVLVQVIGHTFSQGYKYKCLKVKELSAYIHLLHSGNTLCL